MIKILLVGEWPHAIDSNNILKIKIDPIIITNPAIYGDQEWKNFIAFHKETAKAITDFINTVDLSQELCINCGRR